MLGLPARDALLVILPDMFFLQASSASSSTRRSRASSNPQSVASSAHEDEELPPVAPSPMDVDDEGLNLRGNQEYMIYQYLKDRVFLHTPAGQAHHKHQFSHKPNHIHHLFSIHHHHQCLNNHLYTLPLHHIHLLDGTLPHHHTLLVTLLGNKPYHNPHRQGHHGQVVIGTKEARVDYQDQHQEQEDQARDKEKRMT